MLSGRVQPPPSYLPHLANPELALSSSLASPPATPPRAYKHSLSKPITWLNRSSSSTSSRSIPQASPKPTRISEPKVGSSLDHSSLHPSGQLGFGATIVRTPQEALSGSSRTFELASEEQRMEQDILLRTHAEEDGGKPPSPPLPPLPDIDDTGRGGPGRPASPTGNPVSDRVSHSRLSGSSSSNTHHSSPQHIMLAHSHAPSRSTPGPPAYTDLIPLQPPFEAILLSPVPDGQIDPSKLIVALETCTTTYRTSLRTLVSRPSHLSCYLTSLLSPVSETASVYSNASDVPLVQRSNGCSSVLRDHLASSGCFPQPSNAIHVFLDRPSAPYAHVLAYLRSLPGTPEQPEALPRAVQFGSQSPSRVESLLELCDEASYLGLEALHKLCCHEINRTHRAPLPTSAGGSLRGKTGSVRSFHTLVEQCQTRQEAQLPEFGVSKGGTGNAPITAPHVSIPNSCENEAVPATRERSREKRALKYDVGSPPPGWI